MPLFLKTRNVPYSVPHQRIVVGLSGGVDSSVAAWLLKREGHEVVGVFMKNWEDDDTDAYCSSRQDLIDAAACADVIGIELEAVNFSAEYKERVFAHFLTEYEAGRTPNPDVLCNSEIKFRAFLDHAFHLGAEAIATGHYAGVTHEANLSMLTKAQDLSKDQSYFLHRLTQAQLKPARFPLAAITKKEVRVLAREHKIPTWQKKDSTGICFIGERPFREFLSRYLPKTPGRVVTPEGKTVGKHEGLSYYTLGQRQGLGIGGVKNAEEGAWFVAQKRLNDNTLVVAQGHDHPLLYQKEVYFTAPHWISGEPPNATKLSAKLRYRMPDAPCHISEDHQFPHLWRATFETPQWTPTPGQYIVFYDGAICLGGGVIMDTPAL